MTRYSKNFTSTDFPNGTPHPDFMMRLQRARNIYGKPMYITSGGRTAEHNTSVGGVADSSHLIDENDKFRAADIRCRSSVDRYRMVTALLEAGFKRIGIYMESHIHADDHPDKPQNVMWTGKSN